MEWILICTVAFGASILTFFSGFGLGTILTPVFLLFFPIEVAIASTGLVHLANNIFKWLLTGKNANWEVVLKFGIPAVLAAFLGSWILISFPEASPLFSYSLFSHEFHVFPLKLLISSLLFFFACVELLPYFKQLSFDKNKLYLGGFLSGFFGGLSGNQGALRSAFLIKFGLSKESFIGTTIIISTAIDLSRLSVYSAKIKELNWETNGTLILAAILSAISGAFIGNKVLKKVTMYFVQNMVAALLLVLSLLLGLGIV